MGSGLALLDCAAPIFCTDSRVMLRNVNAKIHLCQMAWHHFSGGDGMNCTNGQS